MINVIVELSKYLILTLMIIYTFHCFYTVRQQDEIERNELLRQQMVLIFFMDFTAFLVIYLKTFNFQVIVFYVEMMVFFAAVQILYRIFLQKGIPASSEQYVYAFKRGIYHALQTGYRHSHETACDRGGSQRNRADHSGYDPENEIFPKAYLALRRSGHHPACGSFSSCKNKLRSKTVSDGNSASEVIKITFVFLQPLCFPEQTIFARLCRQL